MVKRTGGSSITLNDRRRRMMGDMADWIIENEQLDAWGQDPQNTEPDEPTEGETEAEQDKT
jgi:hypothetical protein